MIGGGNGAGVVLKVACRKMTQMDRICNEAGRQRIADPFDMQPAVLHFAG